MAGICQLPLNLPGVSTKTCLPAWILWWWKQPILTRTDSTGRYQGIQWILSIERWFWQCYPYFIFFQGSLYPRWTFHRHQLPQGRSFGRDEPKAGNYLNHAGTARFSLWAKHMCTWFTSFCSRCRQRWTFPVTGVNGSARLWWASFILNFSYISWSDRDLWIQQ